MLRNFVLERATNPGTATGMTLAGPVTGRRAMASVFPNGALLYYVIDDGVMQEWGIGTLQVGSPNILQRTTVLGNSAGTTARLNFSGTVNVYCDLPAERTPFVDQLGNIWCQNGILYGVAGGISPDHAVNRGQLDFLGIRVATVLDWASPFLPSGYLWCAGQNVSRTTYASLFAWIGGTYGVGDGVTTFTVPDLRGRVSIGRDDMNGGAAGRVTGPVSGIYAYALGYAGGDQSLQTHAHGVADGGHGHTAYTDVQGAHVHAQLGMYARAGGSSGGNYLSPDAGSPYAPATSTDGAHAHNVGINVSATGIGIYNAGGGYSQNMPPALVLNKIIFAGV